MVSPRRMDMSEQVVTGRVPTGSKKKVPLAIVLGGTNPHRALVQNLQQRGYRVLLVDYLEAPPAAEAADEHVRISALDVEAVHQLARERNASLVISVCLDRTIPVVAEVSHRLGLPTIYTPENALRFTDKVAMKAVFEQAGVPMAEGRVIRSLPELERSGLSHPFIVKPADGTGSLGIGIVRHADGLGAAYAAARDASSSGIVLAEELLQGRELSIDCIVAEGHCHVLLVRERLLHCTPENGLQCYATVSPAPLAETKMQVIQDVTDRLPSAFGIVNAPLLVQGYLTPTNELKVLEIAARLGGGPSSFRAVKLKTGFDLLDAAVDCSLGMSIRVAIVGNAKVYAGISIYARGGTLLGVQGVEKLTNQGVITEYYPYRPAGTVFPDALTARNRVAAVVLDATDHQSLYAKVRLLFAELRVLDTQGRDIMAREMEFIPPMEDLA